MAFVRWFLPGAFDIEPWMRVSELARRGDGGGEEVTIGEITY